MDPIGFLGLCRQEMDRLIEQSPTIPESVIASFDKEFDKKPNLKQPDICGGIERTRIFTGTQSRSLSRSHRHHRTLAIS
jgi:hypothetical protein